MYTVIIILMAIHHNVSLIVSDDGFGKNEYVEHNQTASRRHCTRTGKR